ncbi:unnamed protein product [Sphagnum jensenii]|uniref:Uncharacterized protein n=1 Tax=Sphagnum jensenii TaxID=128206 RepID=A0ABP0VK61_9BRYO
MLEHGKGCWASHNGSPGAVPCSGLISVLNISSHGVHIFISAMPLGLQKSSACNSILHLCTYISSEG